MDFSWTEEQKLIRKTVREFSKRQIRPKLMELEKNEQMSWLDYLEIASENMLH